MPRLTKEQLKEVAANGTAGKRGLAADLLSVRKAITVLRADANALQAKLEEQADLLEHATEFEWQADASDVLACGLTIARDGWLVCGRVGGTRMEPETGLTREAAIARAKELVEAP